MDFTEKGFGYWIVIKKLILTRHLSLSFVVFHIKVAIRETQWCEIGVNGRKATYIAKDHSSKN